ncbi:hypothetical protein [Nocardia sp. NPDC127526]|uniref:hypothetical protein n=1 Tax=Nocardia sp. NPDC127526 TaxID=3345393 RepID=UPI003628981F
MIDLRTNTVIDRIEIAGVAGNFHALTVRADGRALYLDLADSENHGQVVIIDVGRYAE